MHAWATRVVPWRADRVVCHRQCCQDGIGDARAGSVNALDAAGRDPQAGRGGRVTPIAQQRLHGSQGLPRPMQTHGAAQPRRDRVPRRAARRLVAPGHAQPQPVAEVVVAWGVPQPGPTPLTPPRRRHAHEGPGLGGGRAPAVLPPVRHRLDGTRGRVRRGPALDRTRLARPIVAPRGPRAPERLTRDVRPVDRDGRLTPDLAGVLEVPQPGVLLRVHPDAWRASRRTRGWPRVARGARRIAVQRVRPRCVRLRLDAPRVVRRLQPAADGRRAGRMPRSRQPMTPRAPTPAAPRPLTQRGPRRCRRDDLPPCRFPPGVFGAARGRPAPSTRTRSVGRSASDPASSGRPAGWCADPGRCWAPPVGPPRDPLGWTRPRQTSAVAVPPRRDRPTCRW